MSFFSESSSAGTGEEGKSAFWEGEGGLMDSWTKKMERAAEKLQRKAEKITATSTPWVLFAPPNAPTETTEHAAVEAASSSAAYWAGSFAILDHNLPAHSMMHVWARELVFAMCCCILTLLHRLCCFISCCVPREGSQLFSASCWPRRSVWREYTLHPPRI